MKRDVITFRTRQKKMILKSLEMLNKSEKRNNVKLSSMNDWIEFAVNNYIAN